MSATIFLSLKILSDVSDTGFLSLKILSDMSAIIFLHSKVVSTVAKSVFCPSKAVAKLHVTNLNRINYILITFLTAIPPVVCTRNIYIPDAGNEKSISTKSFPPYDKLYKICPQTSIISNFTIRYG